jgi:hypothetical protein
MPGRSDRQGGEPTDVVSVAVRVEEVATALETNLRSPERTVLRLTPPFAPRMRARLHRPSDGEYDDRAGPRPIHVDPSLLVSSVPTYPEPDETAAELDAAGGYSAETHRERHLRAVDDWRSELADRLVDAVVLDTESGPHRVGVKRLG